MGGPAMVEGGGLGVFRPEEIGPIKVHAGQRHHRHRWSRTRPRRSRSPRSTSPTSRGRWRTGRAPTSACCAASIPENRLRVYDIRKVIELIADEGSVLELRPKFGLAMVTAFIRIEGRPMGVIANNPMHLGGAIDSDGSDKAARFLQLCDAFDIPRAVAVRHARQHGRAGGREDRR